MSTFSPVNWLRRLTEPTASVQHPEQRRQSRLLAILLLALMALTLLVVLFNHIYFWAVPILEDSLFLLGAGFVLFLLISYQLSRHGYYSLACVLTLIAFSLGIFAVASFGEFAEVHFLYNLLLVVLIASAFLSIRATLIVIAANTLGMLLFAAVIRPAYFSFIIYGPMSTLLLGSILIWLFTHHRQRLEADRQARLAESEERNRILVELCRDGVFIETVEGRILECNPAGRAMFQYSRDEIIGMYVRDFVSDDFARTLPDIITEEVPEPTERLDKRSDGTLFPVEVYTRFFTLGGKKRLIVFVRDISERKQAEAALRASEERYRIVSELISDYAYSFRVEPDGSFQDEWITADSFTRVTGYKWDELDALGAFALFHPDERPNLPAEQELLRQGQTLSRDYRIITRSGEVRWLHISRHPIWDTQQNRIVRFYATAQDITERKQAEAELAEERNLLRALIDHLPDHIYVKDRLSRFITLNMPTAKYLGAKTPEQAIGKNDFDFFPEAVAAQHYADEQHILATGQGQINAEHRQFDREGHELSLLVTKVPLRDKEGNIIGLVGINRDVTERKLAEAQKLKLALERERLTLVGRFVQAVSHDFRTALANIETSRYLTQKNLVEAEREKVQSKLDNIQRAVVHLTEQIGNLHTISSLADPDVELCDLNTLVESLVAEQIATAQEKNVQIAFTPTADLPFLVADMEELKRAVRHLLVNAVTHTPEGGSVMVNTAQVGEQIFLTISDTGMGIERQHLPHIFDPFYRGDIARPIDSGGVGLGLSIVKMVAEAHGGMISVESTPGRGSVFTLSLPVVQNPLAAR